MWDALRASLEPVISARTPDDPLRDDPLLTDPPPPGPEPISTGAPLEVDWAVVGRPAVEAPPPEPGAPPPSPFMPPPAAAPTAAPVAEKGEPIPSWREFRRRPLECACDPRGRTLRSTALYETHAGRIAAFTLGVAFLVTWLHGFPEGIPAGALVVAATLACLGLLEVLARALRCNRCGARCWPTAKEDRAVLKRHRTTAGVLLGVGLVACGALYPLLPEVEERDDSLLDEAVGKDAEIVAARLSGRLTQAADVFETGGTAGGIVDRELMRFVKAAKESQAMGVYACDADRGPGGVISAPTLVVELPDIPESRAELLELCRDYNGSPCDTDGGQRYLVFGNDP
ncbi:MAG: hypothetical protein AAF721_15445 [Myxococcota bacterium]